MDASFTQNGPKTGPKRCPKRLETVTATSQYVVFLGLHDKFDVTSDTSDVNGYPQNGNRNDPITGWI